MDSAARRPYIFLAILFAIAVAGQTTFTIDVVRDLTGDYMWRPFDIGRPWPSVLHIEKEAVAAGLAPR